MYNALAMASETKSIAVCIAVYNRRDTTLRCLSGLVSADLPSRTSITIYLLDDASSDGTAEAVREEFPEVRLLQSNGDLWWAGGMRVAYGAALANGHDFYIWMNDDVEIKPDAFLKLLGTYNHLKDSKGGEHLVSGAMFDRSKNETSYGGFRLKSRLHPGFSMVLPEANKPVSIDLVNGNMLLIPAAVAKRLGNIPPAYTHTLADWDYGLRAKAIGVQLWLAPDHTGFCNANVPGRLRWGGVGLTLSQRYAKMLHPLALPWRPRFAFLFRHFPIVAPLLGPAPYLKLIYDHLRGRWNP